MAHKIIQLNLNHARNATDMLVQAMSEQGYSLAIISEPHTVPRDSRWVGSTDSPPSAAITWQGAGRVQTCMGVATGPGFCAVRWREWVIFSCYFSP